MQPNEYLTINSQKRVYMLVKILKGEKFSKLNISIKGPAGGLLPKYMNVILTKKSKLKIKKMNQLPGKVSNKILITGSSSFVRESIN